VLEEGDPIALAQAIGTVARARGMKMIAQEVGVSRESLYKSLSGQGNPSFATVVNVARALGLRLTVATATKAA
jgi:probable addiction module antidote protein